MITPEIAATLDGLNLLLQTGPRKVVRGEPSIFGILDGITLGASPAKGNSAVRTLKY